MIKKPSRYPSRIRQRLAGQLLIAAAALTLILSAIQVWISYQEERSRNEEMLARIETIQIQGIAAALWNYSMPELDAQVSSLTHFPYVSFVEVMDKGKIISSAGFKKESGTENYAIPIRYDDQEIGVLTVQVDTAAILLYAGRQVLRILAIQALVIATILTIFMLLMERQVIRHLKTFTNYFEAANRSTFQIPLKLNKSFSNDELDALETAFNDMRANLIQESELRFLSEKRHSTLLANLPGMAFQCHIDQDWTMELVSAGSLELTGYTPEDIIKSTRISYNDIIHPDDRQMVWDTLQRELREDHGYEITYRIRTGSGQIKWVWENGISVYDGERQANLIEGFIIDVTQKKQQERELKAIAAISFALRSALTREEMLSIILEQTTQLLDADGSSLELIDPATGEATIVLATGEFDSLRGLLIPVGKGLNSYIRESGKSYMNNNIANDPRVLQPEIFKEVRAIAGVPLLAHYEMIGFLWFGRKTRIYENELNTLVSIADIAGNAIHRANLFYQTEQRLRQLIGLRTIDAAINSKQNLEHSLNVVIDQAMKLLHADAARVLLIDEDPQCYTVCVSQGFHTEHFDQIPRVIEKGGIDRAVTEQITVQCPDVQECPPGPQLLDILESEGFQSYFAVPLVTKNEVKGSLQVFLKKPFHPNPNWIEFLETLAGQAAIATGDAYLYRDLQHSNLELRLAYDQTIEGWSTALDLRDKETEGHSQRVCALTLKMASLLGIQGEDLDNIRRGALLHDIGKMGVPDDILLKPGLLTKEEWQVMYKHPDYAYQLLSPIEYLQSALDIPYCHHERWDGSGYPRKLKGLEIPLAARIFAVTDVWDALTSNRPYRDAVPEDEVLEYIQEHSGKHFDPDVVALFVKIIKE